MQECNGVKSVHRSTERAREIKSFVFIDDTISTTMWVLQVHHVRVHSFRATHRRTGSHQKNICFVHTAAVPVCPCLVCFFPFLARCPTNSVSSGLRAASRPDLILHRPNGAPAWPLFFVCRPGVLFSGRTSLCADQTAQLPGHTLLGWQVEQRYTTTTRNVTSVCAMRVCALDENNVDIKCLFRERSRSARFQCSRCLADTERCQRTPH